MWKCSFEHAAILRHSLGLEKCKIKKKKGNLTCRDSQKNHGYNNLEYSQKEKKIQKRHTCVSVFNFTSNCQIYLEFLHVSLK